MTMAHFRTRKSDHDAYVINLADEYNVSFTSNVSDLSPFDDTWDVVKSSNLADTHHVTSHVKDSQRQTRTMTWQMQDVLAALIRHITGKKKHDPSKSKGWKQYKNIIL